MGEFDVANLTYVLLSRGLLTPKDVSFITGKLSFEDWNKYNKENREYINGLFVAKNMPEENAPTEKDSFGKKVSGTNRSELFW